MKRILLPFLLLLSFSAISQIYYPLHPSVGDTLERLEKLDYSLFPKVSNTEFAYALIQFDNDNYHLIVTDLEGNTSNKEIRKEDLIEAQRNIEKVNAYYKWLADDKVRKEKEAKLMESKRSQPIRIEGPMTEQMKKEARMNVRLREDARRRREVEQGIRSNDIYIEFN